MVLSKYDDELLLVWKDPETRNRFVIGRLWKNDNGYYFEYIRENEKERGSVDSAIRFGYEPFKRFSDLSKIYHSAALFIPFLNRLPVKERKNNPFELLKKTGGKLNTDTLEFMQGIEVKEKKRSVLFNIAGWRYYQGEKALENLEVGKRIILKLEKDNMYDSHAIEVWNKNERYKLGYVPAIYSRYIDKLVEENCYDAVIKEVNPNQSADEIVKIEFTGIMVQPKITKLEILKCN